MNGREEEIVGLGDTMEILAKRAGQGNVSILAKKDSCCVIVLDRKQDILFLSRGKQLVQAFREYEERCEKGVGVCCPTCDFVLASEDVYFIQKSREFIYGISRKEVGKIFKELGLMSDWQEFVGKTRK